MPVLLMNPKYLNFDNPDYEKFIRSKPCIICQFPKSDGHHWFHARKNSLLLVPLCRGHHTFGADSYHVLEVKEFEAKHNISGEWEIIRLLSEYIEMKRDAEPLEQLERE